MQNDTYVTSHNDISTGDQTSLYNLRYQKSPYFQTQTRGPYQCSSSINNGTKNPNMGTKIVIVVKYCCLVGRGRVCLLVLLLLFWYKLKIKLQKNPKYNQPGLTSAPRVEIEK